MIRAALLFALCLGWYAYSMVAAVQTLSEPVPFDPAFHVDVYYV